MKHIADCPCCGTLAPLYLISMDRNRKLSNQEFGYYRCAGCGLVFIDPVPSNLEHFYKGGYQSIPKSLAELRAIAKKEHYRIEPILAEKQGGDLLEIGPWIGVFSINAKDAGFKVDVIEMSSEASQFLRETVDVNVTNTTNPVAALQAQKCYDVIALWHSLEHLPQPWAVLEAASKRLKPGGILLVAIPNIGGTQAEAMGARWWHLDAPRHLYFWPPRDLARLINRFGLETVKLDTNDRLSGVLLRGAWDNYFRSLIRVPIVRGVVAKLLTPVASLFSNRPGRGAGITAVFRAP